MTNQSKGCTVWFTGLSGSGKTTVCLAVQAALAVQGIRVVLLDGDDLRRTLNADLGFSREDRDKNVRRIGMVADILTRQGFVVLVAAISPYRAVREEVRQKIGRFIEVYMNVPLEVCERRDTKGLYRKARAGEIAGFTGIDDPYEAPDIPDIEIYSSASVMQSVDLVMGIVYRYADPTFGREKFNAMLSVAENL
jgi:adenylylsulfate kinase